ncbi:MAG: hypothetical protein ABW199_07770, partial [Caulobacterales bacterium]
MPLRIVEDPNELDQAYAALSAAFTAWGGGVAHVWRAGGGLEAAADGASFSRRDDLHLYLERTLDKVAIGVALTERDVDLLRIEFMRDAPARRKRRAAIAADDGGEFHLLLATDFLADQDIREPFRRLAGAPLVKRAEVGGRDYVFLGPFSSPRIADAVAAVAGLSPAFQRHVAKLGDLAANEDDTMDTALYRVSRGVARAHKVQRAVAAALHEKLAGAGYQLDESHVGPLRADFVMSRAADSLVFEIRANAELSDLVRGIGQLTLVAPRGARVSRVFVLPASLGDMGDALTPFRPALEELSVSLLLYDVTNGGVA